MKEKDSINYLGLDISKSKLDLAGPGIKHQKFDNTKEGLAKLVSVLKSLQQAPRIVLEPTGGYERLPVLALQGAGLDVCMVNTRHVRSFATSMGKLAKTDKIDALLLAEFARHRHPRVLAPHDQNIEELRALYDFRQELVKLHTRQSNRLETAPQSIRKDLKRHIAYLLKDIVKIESKIKNFINNNPTLQKKDQCLQAVSGVGPTTSAVILAHVPELGSLEDKEAAALVGLAPYNNDSGNRQGYRSCRGGRPNARHVLFMSALTAARTNPILAAFYQHLIEKGKAPKVALIAVARKLLVYLNRLLKKLALAPATQPC